ncbi:hypothetical protein YC2023_002692 [Brassica napus]
MDAEESSSDDDDEPVRDEFVRWLRRITAQEMRLSEYPRCNLLFKSNRRVSVWTRGERQRFFGALFSVGVAYADPDEANYKSSSPIDPPSTTLCRHFQERKMRLMASHLSLQILHQTMQTLPGKKELESKNQYKVKALNIVLAHGSMSLSGAKSPVAWQITLRSAEKKKEPGASEDESDEDLCILIFGSLLHSDKVEVEFIKKESLTTEELEAFVSALQVAGQNVDEIRQVEVEELERHLVRVIANQADIPLLYVPLEAVMSKYYGESERLLGAVFSQANEISDGAIIFLDEDKKVVVIAATNRKQDLDPALISRFESMIMVGLANPSRNHRPTTSRKSSRRLPEILPDDFQEVFHTTSWKSSGLHGSLLTKSPFHNRSDCFGFSDLEDFSDDLPVSRLKYNALDDFQEVFQTTSISVVWTS